MTESSFTPREIVSELDRFIVGQQAAKRAVAIALRNRWRRQQLDDTMRDEVLPKNILMIGPTGVGKTEIARRLAKLAQAPFIKIEATKFTEVGYVGRDVEQIIRDLVDTAIHMTRERQRKLVQAKAEVQAEERVIDALVGESAGAETRDKFRRMLRAGELDDREIEIQVTESAGGMPTMDIPGMPGAQMGMLNLNDMFGKAFGQQQSQNFFTFGFGPVWYPVPLYHSGAVKLLFIRVEPRSQCGTLGGIIPWWDELFWIKVSGFLCITFIRIKVIHKNPQCHDVRKHQILRDCNGSPNRIVLPTHVPT